MSLDDAASSLRSNAADTPILLQALAERLSDVPGVGLQVSRRRGKISRFFGDIPYVNDFRLKTAPVSAIRVQVGTKLYQIEASGYAMTCSVGSSASRRGVAFSEWIAELTAELSELCRISDEQVQALARLVLRGEL